MPRTPSIRHRDAKIVRRAVREKDRRDYAREELDQIKREMITTAADANVSTLKMVHPRTGQRLVLSHQRNGAPVEEARIGEIAELLPDHLTDTLFPPVVRRSFDWDAIDEFLAREQPKNTDLSLAQRRLVEIVQQDASWTLRIFDAETVFCLECAEILAPPKHGIRLCDTHRRWYKISSFMRALGSDGDDTADLRRFNDERQKNYRARWLRADAIEAWEQNNTREAKAERRARREAAVNALRN